ncbi:MAG: nuclear transport factor 2 family protein [Sulfuriferula sp.]
MKISKQDFGKLRRLEENLWREETRFDIPYLQRILAADFFEFGRSGRVYTREECLAAVRQPIEALLPLPDFAVRLLAVAVAQVTYTSVVTFDGAVFRAHRSSIWSHNPEIGWVLRFHQGTPLPDVA